jgi:glycosyltransferase involved in cell wall biosynthesis
MTPYRIALLAPDFPTESAGGAGSFLHRLAMSLRDHGHEVEVFVISSLPPGRFDYYGIPVHCVALPAPGWVRRLHSLRRIHRLLDAGHLFHDLVGAWALARAFHARDREAPFHLVHGSDWRITSLFVRPRAGRVHAVRCCWSRRNFRHSDQRPTDLQELLLDRLEIAAARRATTAYAPSRFLALQLEKNHAVAARIVRPPLLLDRHPAPLEHDRGRYLFHFGTLGPGKGSDIIARALPLAWRQEPDLRMVWAGSSFHGPSFVDSCRAMWGERSGQVDYRGLLSKSDVYTLLSGAIATVLPSRWDNLPNTAIESLLMRVPVIAAYGASLDELVEPGACGELFPPDDVEALAALMVRAWRGEILFERPPAIFSEMTPQSAVQQLMLACGFDAHPVATAEPSLEGPRLIRLHPPSATAGVPFHEQPGGLSAMAAECEHANVFTRLYFDGDPLPTKFAGPHLVSALVPTNRIAAPAVVEVRLVDEITGVSNPIEFTIHPVVSALRRSGGEAL